MRAYRPHKIGRGLPLSSVGMAYRDRRAMGLTVAAGWILTAVLGLLSDGVHHDDDLVHFLMARWSWWYPGYLLNVWGRPGMTIPTAAVSWFADVDLAWHAARMLSATVSAGAALIAARLAFDLGLERPWRVVVLCFAQPLFLLLGLTTLTENFTALYLVAAVALLNSGRAAWASMVFSLALLTRHEAVVFVPIWLFAIILLWRDVRRPVTAALLTIWAPVAHNLIYGIALGAWPFQIFLQPGGSTQYLPTGWSAYVPDAIYAASLSIFLLAIVGCAGALPTTRSALPSANATRRMVCRLLVVAIPIVFFILHAFFKAVGIYASGGFARFLVAVAPFLALCAVSGWDQLTSGAIDTRRRTRAALIGFGAMVVIWIALECEIASGRLPVKTDLYLIIGRAVSALVGAAFLVLGFARRQRRVLAARRLALAVLSAVVLVQMYPVARPLQLSAHQRLVGDAVRWMEENGFADRPIFAADPWFAYALGLVEHSRALKDAALLASMPVGTIVVWDSIYSESDYHGLDGAHLIEGSAYRSLTQLRFDGAYAYELRLFEKIAPTPEPAVLRPSYPPPLKDRYPAIRGVFYVRDPSRPKSFVDELSRR